LNQVERVSDEVKRGSPLRRVAVVTVGAAVTVGVIALVLFWDIPLFPG